MAYKNRTNDGDVSHQVKVYAPQKWWEQLEYYAREFPQGKMTRGDFVRLAVDKLIMDINDFKYEKREDVNP